MYIVWRNTGIGFIDELKLEYTYTYCHTVHPYLMPQDNSIKRTAQYPTSIIKAFQSFNKSCYFRIIKHQVGTTQNNQIISSKFHLPQVGVYEITIVARIELRVEIDLLSL